jgi:hypothetical protein
MELMTPFVMYLGMGMVPMRIFNGVPEFFCVMVVVSQATSCVLAMLGQIVPLVLYKAAREPIAKTA